MKIAYFLIFIIAVINLLIVLMSGVLGVNLYKKHGKDILKGFFKFLLVLSIFYIALAISGLTI